MALLIPNLTEVTGPAHQARPDSRDFDALSAATANYGVASGCAVTATGTPDVQVHVAAGSLVFSPPSGIQINISIPATAVNVLSGTGGLAADTTNPRIDLIVVNSSGTVSCLHGTPAAVTTTSGPVYPSRASIGVDANGVPSSVVLARIDVAANATTVTAGNIVDKRVFPQPPIVPPHPGTNATVVFPGQLTQALVTAGGVGACFILKAGVHRSVSITPLDNQSFIGEPGAIMDGGMITRTLVATTGTTGTTLIATTSTFTSADAQATMPTYVSGLSWASNAAASISSVTNGTTVVMSDTVTGSPVGRTITLTRPPAAGIDTAFNGTATNVVIRNLLIRNYANVTGRAAVHPQILDDTTQLGTNWTVTDCEITANSSIGIRACDTVRIDSCRVHHNGDIGIGGNGTNGEISNNEVYFNNAYNMPLGFDSAGMKLAQTTGLLVHHNRVYSNAGLGIWTDVDCFGSIIEYNTIWSNSGGGISVETCYNTKVRYNTVYGNGLADSSGSFYDPGNILISSSPNIEVNENVVGTLAAGNYHGIGVFTHDRVKVTSGGFRSVANMVTNSTTTITSSTAAFTQADINAKVTGTNLAAGPPVTTIVSVTNATTAVLSVAATGAGSGGTLNIQRQLDQFGALPGAGQATASGWYQRCYNVDIHNNHIVTTGTNVCAAGLVSDIDNDLTAGYCKSRNIRFYNNTYNPPGSGQFAWNNGTQTMTQWQAFGMDAIQTQLAPSTFVPTTEAIQPAPDPVGISAAADNLMSTQTTNISGAAPTIDLSKGRHQRLTVSGNVTGTPTVTNVPDHGFVIIEFINGGTFTRVNTFTNMKPAGAALAGLTSGAGKTDTYTFVSDGTNITEIARAVNCA